MPLQEEAQLPGQKKEKRGQAKKRRTEQAQ